MSKCSHCLKKVTLKYLKVKESCNPLKNKNKSSRYLKILISNNMFREDFSCLFKDFMLIIYILSFFYLEENSRLRGRCNFFVSAFFEETLIILF